MFNRSRMLSLFGATLLLETDHRNCTCSYCHGSHRMKWGLNVPKQKAFNSWFVIKYGPGKYFRFTLPFLGGRPEKKANVT